MPADYIDMPAHIATRVAVAAEAMLRARTSGCSGCVFRAEGDLGKALREAREAERVTVEKVRERMIYEYRYTEEELADPKRQAGMIARRALHYGGIALRAAGYTVGE